MAAIQSQLAQGAVPNAVSNVCPEGTKFHVLEVGWLECDEAFVIRGSNSSLKSTEHKSFVNKRRELPMYCILIEHPHEGLILWETGCGKEYPEIWGPIVSDIFARIKYEPQHELRAAVEATGNRVEDVKKIIIGHLHLDHAGGLDEFLDNKEVEIWVHERELTGAFWSVATGADAGVYLEHYLDLKLNWKTFNDQTMDFCQGITLHHLPGHTDGLIGMQINMPETGTFFFVSDHCHWKDGIPQGWLARDHPAWFRSTQRLKQLMRVTKGQMIPGHDKDTFLALQKQAKVFT
ncbi:beta-lactamase-like protein [Aspergillus heterothallicus]